jgi:Flp pilus assembly protein TadD
MAAPSGAFAKPNDQAWELIRDKKPAEAIVKLDRVIATEASRHEDERRQIYCAHSPAETLMYTGMAAQAGKGAVVLDPTWCMAIFLKGFALIDLNRPDEAKPLFDRAVEMAPMNSQFLSELAEWHKVRREWGTAFTLFERSSAASELSNEENRIAHKGRALRGMGFVLIEQGKLDEAERLFHQALELDPNDASAKNELQYIEEQRLRASTQI